jgi:general secretion pathway protein G
MGKGMRYANFLDTLLIRGHSQKCVRAFTLIELLVAIAIVGTLGAIGVPTYNGYIDRARNGTAMADIVDIGLRISTFQAEHGRPPNTLAEAGLPAQIDPWGRPYQYLRIVGVLDPNNPQLRKDHGTHPINSDFDLYSMGKDGNSVPPLTSEPSWDDIVRANNGAFVGMASDY